MTPRSPSNGRYRQVWRQRCRKDLRARASPTSRSLRESAGASGGARWRVRWLPACPRIARCSEKRARNSTLPTRPQCRRGGSQRCRVAGQNGAGYTAVVLAEDQAAHVKSTTPRLACWHAPRPVQAAAAAYFHRLVFDGNSTRAYRPGDEPNPSVCMPRASSGESGGAGAGCRRGIVLRTRLGLRRSRTKFRSDHVAA